MKKFTIPCDFGAVKHPFQIYVGDHPGPDRHPLEFQARWLEENRGGRVPANVMESFSKLRAIALENNVSLEELCMYALGENQEEKNSTVSTNVNQPPPEPFVNTVEVIGDATALRQCFDGDFNFLLITMEQEGQVWQMGIIVRAENKAELELKIKQRLINMKELDEYGIVKFVRSQLITDSELNEILMEFN
jgi:Domain of unknown function (DUF2610)